MDYNTAVDEGVIAVYIPGETKEIEYELAEVRRGTLERIFNTPAKMEFPVRRNLYFEKTGGRFSEFYAGFRQFVRKGDLLAVMVFDTAEMENEKMQLLIKWDQFEQQYINDEAGYIKDMEKARDAMLLADDTGWEMQALQLARLELSYEEFVYRNSLTRRGFEKDLEELEKDLLGDRIYAPFDGIILFRNDIRKDQLVEGYPIIFTIADFSIIRYEVTTGIEIVRFGDVLTIKDSLGRLEFDVRVSSDPFATGDRKSTQFTFQLEPLDPDYLFDYMADNDLSFHDLAAIALTAYPQVSALDDVLLVPATAILIEDMRRYVYIYEDNMPKKRFIIQGARYMDDVQILSGLEEGQWVVRKP